MSWSSSDVSKATIDNNGNLELLGVGLVTITCYMTDNEDVYDTITVTISAVLPSTSDTIITPNNDTILQNFTETYTVYKYIDNVVQADTFTITATGVSTDYYTLTVLSGNSFSVKNIKNYPNDNLTIHCVNDITSEETTFEIELKGYW